MGKDLPEQILDKMLFVYYILKRRNKKKYVLVGIKITK